jgi:hydroxyacylglutathione hydrolase
MPVLIFSGGDLLVGSVWRPDLLGRELVEKLAPRLYDSLFGKILKLTDYVEVLPTHGAGSLCGRSIALRLLIGGTGWLNERSDGWVQPGSVCSPRTSG